MSSDDVAIRVQSISKCYEIYGSPRNRLKQFVMPPLQRLAGQPPKQYFREFWALKDVSLEVKKGEAFGIIGRNGSGKSTLLQLICGTLNPTGGSIQTNGRIAALLELGSGFNPEFSGRENVFINGSILGLSEAEIGARFEDIASFADIGDFIDQPVKTYSSGMFVRLAFAVQAHIDASIVIIDEALAVGDVFFQQKCHARLERLRNLGAAILLVSHSMPDIEQYCQRAILLDHGVPRFMGTSSEAAKHYYLLHQAETRPAEKPVTDPVTAQVSASCSASVGRPSADAFIDLTNKSQIGTGQARCTGVAICNARGEPCNVFRQGDTASFYYEFELNEAIDVPICGIVISNQRGIIVHGKNSWQYDGDVEPSMGRGSKVVCQQNVVLDLAQGEYVFEVGLASVSTIDWGNRERISHEETASCFVRICHLPNIGSFSVGLAVDDGVPVLTHHGVANLPGTMKIAVVQQEPVMQHGE